MSQPSVNEIVTKAQSQAIVYRDTFKNLLTEETKTFEIYDKKGEVKKRRTIVSTFVVYQLSKDESRTTEYRNVISVDGKKVDNPDSRAQDFFQSLAKSESSAKEFDKLQNESLRYDDDILITGLTLYQAPVLGENLRPLFDFRLAENNTPNTFVIAFEQTRPSTDITVNVEDGQVKKPIVNYDVGGVDASSPLKPLMRGRLWIDSATFQIRLEEREITIQPEGFEKSLIVVSERIEYQPSGFGIMTPKKIVHRQYRVAPKKGEAIKEAEITLEYDKFTKPDVEIKSSEVKQSN